MASDLPDMRPSSLAMARMLVKTISTDEGVQQRMREDFDHPPCLRTIRRLRIEAALCALPPANADLPFKAFEGHRPDEVRDRAARVSNEFLAALWATYPERRVA